MATSEVLRRRLVRELERPGGITSATVRGAFLSVPRELFIPEVAETQGLDAVYRDRVFVTKQDSRGQAISSSSQPGIMAPMLELLDVQPGHRVLEVGAGTGYNAALVKHIVGKHGRVTAVDIDPDTAKRAARAVRTGGYTVTVRAADGHKGWSKAAPYDRIIATVSTDEIPRSWFRQLVRGGVLVVPLRPTSGSFGPQVVVAFRREPHALVSSKIIAGGFMTMRHAPGADAMSFPVVQVYERARGNVSYVGASGAAIDRMSSAARQRLVVALSKSPRVTLIGRGPAQRMLGLTAYVGLGADVRRRVEGLGWSTGVVDPEGRGVAFLNSSMKDEKIAVRLQAFGSRTAEAELRKLIGMWRTAGSQSFEALRISVRFTEARPRAWRATKRGRAWLTFDWNDQK
jgi:protein-L-isoaspartate(D-aspartate) O-methyltransferase